MKKTAKKTPGTEEAAEQTLMLPLAELVRTELRAFVVSCGMHALVSMLELDREELCGPAYARGRDGGPSRAGSTPGRLVMGGRKVTVRRPRVRDADGEVPLPAWVEFCAEDPLHQRALEQMVLGVTTRKYERSLEPVDEALAPSSTSKSAVSRRFKAMTQDQLATLMNTPLDALNLLAVMIDGIHIKDHLVLIALGIDDDGGKHVLGLWEGATENHRVCSDLLANLIERGLPVDRSLLFIIDGSKALRKAIRSTFGDLALIQRCQVHKIRNVLDYLPKDKQVGTRKAIRDAYASSSASAADKRLRALAAQLKAAGHPGASASMLEGLAETLTVKRFGLEKSLERTLSTTNPIENLNGGIRYVIRRVKRWRGGGMVLRWVAAGAIECSRGFRRVRGYNSLPKLEAALRRHQLAIQGEEQVVAQERMSA